MKTTLLLSVIILMSANVAFAEQAMEPCDNTVAQSTPTAHFKNNRDGTVTDLTTGLMWKTCVKGLKGSLCNVGDAYKFNFDLLGSGSHGFSEYDEYFQVGYDDWRVPNIKELATLIETNCSDKSINTDIFPNGDMGIVLSSTPVVHDFSISDAFVWAIDFSANGNESPIVKVDFYDEHYIRYVRGGVNYIGQEPPSGDGEGEVVGP